MTSVGRGTQKEKREESLVRGEHGLGGLGPNLDPKPDPIITGFQFLKPRPYHVCPGTCFRTDPIFRSSFKIYLRTRFPFVYHTCFYS